MEAQHFLIAAQHCHVSIPPERLMAKRAAEGNFFTCSSFHCGYKQPLAHLPVEGQALLGSDELAVGLVGSDDDCGYSFLVLRGRCRKQRECSEGNVILAVGQAAFVVTIRAEAGQGNRHWK